MKIKRKKANILFLIATFMMILMIAANNILVVIIILLVTLILEYYGIVADNTVTESKNKALSNNQSKITSTINLINTANSLSNDSTFKSHLNRCGLFLNEMENTPTIVSEVFLDQIEQLLLKYLDIKNKKIHTRESKMIIEEIEESFTIIDNALESIYSKGLNNEHEEINATIIALENKLVMDGVINKED